MTTLNAKSLALSDWVKLYNKEVILNANCGFFPEFKNVKCIIKDVKRSKSNTDLFVISIKIGHSPTSDEQAHFILKRRNKTVKTMQVDSGMTGLTVTLVK